MSIGLQNRLSVDYADHIQTSYRVVWAIFRNNESCVNPKKPMSASENNALYMIQLEQLFDLENYVAYMLPHNVEIRAPLFSRLATR